MISIRKYEEKDSENVKFACLNAEGYNSITDDDTATAERLSNNYAEIFGKAISYIDDKSIIN